MKPIVLSVLSALLLFLSFPPADLGVLAWIGFIPFFFALEGQPLKKTFWLSTLTGFLFFLGLLFWIHHVTWAGMFVLAFYLSLCFSLFAIAVRFLNRRLHFVLIPLVWVALEFLRSTVFTGFGWGLLAYSQWKFLDLIQIAEWTGAYGVSFLVMLGNVALYQLLRKGAKRRERFFSFVLFLILSGSVVGYALFYPFPSSKSFFRVSVIQGNIPQDLKWDASLQETILKKYEALTRTVSANHPETEVIFWPETAVPGFLPDEKLLLDRLSSLSRDSGKSLLVGSPWVEEGLIYNSALLWKEGKILQRYDKLHLVPFGEFIPFEKTFPILREWIVTGDFYPGKDATIFKHPRGSFSVLICFEDIFPDLVRRFAKGSDFLVNITNDAWFGKSGAPFQHAQASVFRAIENRRSVLRVTNTGYSCLIGPTGKILQDIEVNGEKLFVTGWRSWEVPLSKTETFYTRFGDLFAWGCTSVILLGSTFPFFLSLIPALRKRV